MLRDYSMIYTRFYVEELLMELFKAYTSMVVHIIKMILKNWALQWKVNYPMKWLAVHVTPQYIILQI